MQKKLRIVIAQLNFIVGDISGNLKKHIDAACTARDILNADIIVFPELSMTGYSPEDLLLRPAFLDASTQALHHFIKEVSNIHCVIGHPFSDGKHLYNGCSFIYNQTVLGRYAKQHLPNYGVFDERRYFTPGTSHGVVSVHGIPIGTVICEDLWFANPVQQAAAEGARLILSPNASPFEINKQAQREQVLKKRAQSSGIPIVYANSIGGQDDLVFDGGSMVVDGQGNICQHAGSFKENLLPVDIEIDDTQSRVETVPFTVQKQDEKIYNCLVFGVRDYLQKNRFPGALVGLSGGIDSALTLAIAVDAIGKENVTAIIMPSRYTSDISMEDAVLAANNLGVNYEIVSIEPMFTATLSSLAPAFGKTKSNLTEENIQARCRGLLLMAFSNETGKIVLNTSNRSEMAVGYSTLYGDMVGGFSVLKDVPKTLVYQLAEYRNQLAPVIPERTIHRPPSAELALNQKDEDSLAPYATLDRILELYLNQELSAKEIISQGFDSEVVTKTIGLVKKSEYKRHQAPIGVRINHGAFGRNRRYPITSGYTD